MNKKTHKREDYKSKGFPQCCRSVVPGSRCVRPATTDSVVPITYRLKMHGRPLLGGDLALASSQFKLTTEWNFRALYRSRERKRVDDGLPVRKSELNVKITFIGADWPPCVGSRTYMCTTVDGSFSDRLYIYVCVAKVWLKMLTLKARFQSFRYIKLKVNILGEP